MISFPWFPRQLGLRHKLSLWSLLAMLWVMGLGGGALHFIHQVADVSLSLVDHQAVPLIEVGQLKGRLWEVYMREVLYAGLNNVQEMKKLEKELAQLTSQLNHQIETNKNNPLLSQTWLDRFQVLWEQFQSVLVRARGLSRSYAKDEAMQLLFAEGRQAFDALLLHISGEEARYRQQMEQLRSQATLTQESAVQWTSLLTLLFALMVLGGGWYARSVTRALGRVCTELATSAAQMSATIRIQEQIIAQQTASVQETNTTLADLGSGARRAAEQADSAAHGAQAASQAAAQGKLRMAETLRSMESTKERMDVVSQQLQQLQEQTGQIREITDLVADFANETKMLALNAAVEAVRAGEQGKGFAVLAVETRKLADESKRSVGQINTLVTTIQQATQATVQVAEEVSKSLRGGIVITRNTAKGFQSLGETVDGAAQSAQEIHVNVRQQAAAVQQAEAAMRAIHTGAHESTLGIAQVRSGIQALNDAAHTLQKML
ncbi:MAG: MCP four helix bundle domain-containing protein [Magnetococcales bacterium]|nr:MCP four helix bundle domain-containing protein [Magnetococcales bacterium]